ncbi:MAG: phosphoesterase [Archaeoglobales archaeon]|nr:MAG: phosphoesterase [Archaeoglobales archaeon]
MNIKFTPERALMIGRTAVIADLHLGLENVIGMDVRVQIDDVLERIEMLSDHVDRIVIAGDLKHEFGRNLPYEWEDVKRLLRFLLREGLDVVIVRGNHDNFLGAIVSKFGLEIFDQYKIEGWTIVHGHKNCECNKRIVMGHEHPSIKVRIDGIYSFHCFLRVKGEIFVLPAFSPLVSGSDVTSCRFISPILSNVSCDEVEVYAVDDEVMYLGTLKDLRDVISIWR